MRARSGVGMIGLLALAPVGGCDANDCKGDQFAGGVQVFGLESVDGGATVEVCVDDACQRSTAGLIASTPTRPSLVGVVPDPDIQKPGGDADGYMTVHVTVTSTAGATLLDGSVDAKPRLISPGQCVSAGPTIAVRFTSSGVLTVTAPDVPRYNA